MSRYRRCVFMQDPGGAIGMHTATQRGQWYTIIALAALVLTGCSGANDYLVPADSSAAEARNGPARGATPSGPSIGELDDLGDTAARTEYARYYDQALDWSPCGDLDCAEVTVPLDWTRPSEGSIKLAVTRRPAKDEGARIGSLLYNPGGPGSSGVDMVTDFGDQLVTDAVARQYDLVGFDPRGVGSSRPIDCLTDQQMDEWLAADYPLDTPQGLERAQQSGESFARGCERLTGPLLAFVDTWSAARDMEIMRAALGDDELHYLGASYGTLLGATFADFYPDRVGRMVLDGALNPDNTGDDVLLEQAKGFDRSLRAYVEACLAGETGACPLSGSVDQGMQQIAAMIDAAQDAPLETGTDRELTAAMFTTGVITALYDDDTWPYLSEALAQAKKGDGSDLLYLADLYADRGDSGAYGSNLLEAFQAINCLDYPALQTDEEMKDQADRLAEVAPVFGPRMAYGDLLCSQWPYPAVRTPEPIKAAGAAPILVVGTTGDPATPYAWAKELAKQLDSAVLLTYEGEGHTAYTRGSQCIDEAVDAYLLEGTMPKEGTRCR